MRLQTQEKFKAGRDLATIRQWYYSMPIAEREKFKEDMKVLVEASKPFTGTCFWVMVNYQTIWHHNEGDSVSEKANRAPSEILKAIEEWDRAEEQNPTSELFL